MPIRISLDGLDEAAISRAFRWAAERGADIISCSWGPADDQDRRAWYSDYGKAISVAAPSSGGRNGIWTTDVGGAGPQKRPIRRNSSRGLRGSP